jgi:hypothetical protein
MARRRTNVIRPHDQASWRVEAKPTPSGRQRAPRWVAGEGVHDGHEVVDGRTSGRCRAWTGDPCMRQRRRESVMQEAEAS